MTDKSRAPHKLSVARVWRRVASTFRRWGDPPATTDDYRRATEDRNRAEQTLLRDERAGESLRDLGRGI
jgi:hypothetical protein